MISGVRLREFRNLANSEVEFSPGSHLIFGPNGAGKTSLLEAFYLGSTTKSFRTKDLRHCLRFNEEAFHLRLKIRNSRNSVLELGWGDEGVYRARDGIRTPLAEHLSLQPLVSWTAGDGDILVGPPEERRRLLDRGSVLLKPSFLGTLSRYKRILGQKRELLKTGGRGLAAWNELLVPEALAVQQARVAYIDRLNRALKAIRERVAAELPHVGFTYKPSPEDALDGEECVSKALKVLENEEQRAGRPLVGPQRDRIPVVWGEKHLKHVASAGEKKVAGLLLLAAQGQVLREEGLNPVYLIDDIDAELDTQRLQLMWGLFKNEEQVFATSARPEAWKALKVKTSIEVHEGKLKFVS